MTELKLNFGKYKGQDPMGLVGRDEQYVFWLLDCRKGGKFIKEDMYQYLQHKVADRCVMPFGKHKGLLISYLRIHETDYINWLAKNSDLNWL
jgi:uncharacterized protein (DUF3820 family)